MELIRKYFPNLTKEQEEQLSALEGLYRDWNSKINVISRKDMDFFYERHVLHSMSIARFFSFEKGARILDIGTGGGFPGIPLAILFPESSFYLVDSIGKKIQVTQQVADALGLENVMTAHQRVEKIKQAPFHYAVTRAVASLSKLCNWTMPLLKKKAWLIALKGGELREEVKASGYKAHIFNLATLYKEAFFEEKKLVAVQRGSRIKVH